MLNVVKEIEKKMKAKKLDDEKTALLISCVRDKNCLWDMNHEDFKKVTIKKKLWDEIGTQLNITGTFFISTKLVYRHFILNYLQFILNYRRK